MAGKLAYERFYWFHGRIKAKGYPNAKTLAEHFEISQKQAQRDIEFIRDRLCAPLLFNQCRRGYEYTDGSYELPPVWFNEEELLALCLALRLSAAIPDKKLKKFLHELVEKFLHFRSAAASPGLGEIEDKISLKNIEYYRVDETIFRHVVSALFRKQAIIIRYRTPYTGEETQRIVLPLHLLCYMGNWHLIAFCSLKGELRDFALSRIREIQSVAHRIDLPDHLSSIKDYLRKDFGLMKSSVEAVEVCLRFTPEVSEWISEQIWHRNQKISPNDDGSTCLRFPVEDFREVRREILRYGAQVEVLSPPELRQGVKKEIEKMGKIYQ